jgi:hypothetical protein
VTSLAIRSRGLPYRGGEIGVTGMGRWRPGEIERLAAIGHPPLRQCDLRRPHHPPAVPGGGGSAHIGDSASGYRAPVNRLVIVEFPDMVRVKAFYNSAEYQPLLALRQRAARSNLLAIECV